MANKIQIKRSTTNASVTGLSNGELAFTSNGNVFYVGSPNGNGVSIRIGGEQVPGILTSNQALVANTTGGIDKVIVANLVPTAIWANGAAGSAGQLLTSNSTGGVYWNTPAASVAGSNTQVQFNDSGTLAGDSGLTFDKTTDTLSTNNVLALGTVNGSVLSVGGWVIANNSGVFTSGGVNASVITVGTAFRANTTNVISTGLFSGNGAGLTSVDAATVGGNTASTLRTYSDTMAATAYSNATSYADTKAATAYSNATSYADTKAATAYSNATSYADTKAATAYSNATSYADTKAGTAYSNAMADTLSRNGSYTGNNTLGGTNTVISSNLILTGAVSSNIMPSANVTYNLGNNTIRWNEVHASNVHSVTGYFDGNVEISGDLIVTGNVTTVNVSSVVVSDPMIYLAGNNYSSDLVDIGLAANYYDGSTQRHTGFFRDATDGIWKLFANSTQELSGNNVVNTTAVGYTTATLIAYLSSGGLTTNSSSANLIANSTYTVGIVANNLTLTTALAGTSGGTGKTTVANNAILVGNSTNGYNELTLGTSGYVLQSNGTAVVYDVLDGGTF